MRFLAILLTSLLLITTTLAKPIEWQTLAKGIDYTVINYRQPYLTSRLHALRINPTLYRLNVITAQDIQRKAGFASTYAKASKAWIAINGGFFNLDYEPLGLRINEGKILTPVKLISWWGIFTVQNKKPNIMAVNEYKADNQIDFAIQAGPRLLIDGKVPKLKDTANTRSALCINHTDQIIMVVTEHLPLTTTALANILRTTETEGGLNCENALNLDGGHSSQIYAKIAEKIISVPNLSPVADAIVVKPF